MLEFSVLTSILQAYGKVITLKYETILNNNFLENYILENCILFVICCIVKLQVHERLIKYKNIIHYRLSNVPCLPHSYFCILSDACF